MTSATPKPRAGEYVPDLTSESPDYRDRAEKIGEIYDDIAYLIAERDLLRERERELVELLKAHLAHTTQSIKDIGGCDHSVGICCCDMIRDCDAASALLAKPRP